MNKDTKIQIRLIPHGTSGDYKAVQYRIDPSELNWFRRIFCNSFEYIYNYLSNRRTYGELINDPYVMYIPLLVKPGTVKDIKNQFKTLKDVNDFITENNKRFEKDLEEWKFNTEVIEY